MTENPHAPRARAGGWSRFSLRTLFVVLTVVACWLGYELNWIRQRHALIESNVARLVDELGYDDQAVAHRRTVGADLVAAPGMLRLFGEQGIKMLTITFVVPKHVGGGAALVAGQHEFELARRLFPEAEVRGEFQTARVAPQP